MTDDLEHKLVEMTEPEFTRAINKSLGMIEGQIQQYRQMEHNLQQLYSESVAYQQDTLVKYYYDETAQAYFIKHTPRKTIGFATDLTKNLKLYKPEE